jgi:guanyl-specific ribonuclease Sa
VAGGAGALPSGGTSLVLSGAGVAVTAEGAMVAATGVTNVGAGINTITHAVSMSGSSSSSGPPPASPPTPAPAAGSTPASPPPPGPAATPPTPAAPSPAASPPIPAKATTVLNQVKASNGAPPAGYRGGGTFANDGRANGQVLPRSDAAGKPITYREYDVNRFQPGVNRGAERVVVGSDGKAYYTSDHYRTFTPIP